MLGIEFICSSNVHYVSCRGNVLQPKDLVLPGSIVEVRGSGGGFFGTINVERSLKEPEKRLVLKPTDAMDGALPYVIIELGATKSIREFTNIVARCLLVEGFIY